jgi:hypothetical protein
MHTGSICNSALHDLTLVKPSVTRVAGVGESSLDILTVIQNKTHQQLQKFHTIFNKTLSLELKNNKILK